MIYMEWKDQWKAIDNHACLCSKINDENDNNDDINVFTIYLPVFCFYVFPYSLDWKEKRI